MKNGQSKQIVCNQMQARYLKGRIEAANRAHNNVIYKLGSLPEPAKVTEARRIVREFEKREQAAERKVREKARIKLTAATEKAWQAVLFGHPDKAKAAVEAFERLTFQ